MNDLRLLLFLCDVLEIRKATFVLVFEIQWGRDLAFIIMYISSFVSIRVAQALGIGICLFIYFSGVCCV